MRDHSLGISESDIAKIPVGLNVNMTGTDSDNDGLPDKIEQGLGTQINNPDSDNDSYSDYAEIFNDYNPLGPGKLVYDQSIINHVKGRIILQVQGQGQAWYVHPDTGKRYYMKDGDAAFQIMRGFGLGITNTDLASIHGIINGEYSNTFEVKDGAVYYGISLGTGEFNVYTGDIEYPTGELLVGADPATFEMLLSGNFIGRTYARDAQHIYVQHLQISNADPATFAILNNGDRGYSKDSQHVYLVATSASGGLLGLNIMALEDADPATFEIMPEIGYAKDANHVYHSGIIVPDADPATFQP